MRQVLTALLLLIFGVSLPFGAESFRFCLLEDRILVAVDECAGVKKCCDGCEAENEQHQDSSCCLEVKKLPDSNLPAGPERVPVLYAVELSADAFSLVVPTCEWKSDRLEWSENILSLPPPSSRRAVLGVWTI